MTHMCHMIINEWQSLIILKLMSKLHILDKLCHNKFACKQVGSLAYIPPLNNRNKKELSKRTGMQLLISRGPYKVLIFVSDTEQPARPFKQKETAHVNRQGLNSKDAFRHGQIAFI